MKNIIKTWMLISIVTLSFTQGSIHKNMDMKMDTQSSSHHSKQESIQMSDTCDYVCSLVFFHKNEISLDVLSFTSFNVTFSNALSNLNIFKPFKPPIHTI